ncbi:MAG: oligoendopeptidase F [Myxococcales bacterium]|nr:oligoendopeptidase F [Myxococcales bacterium]
MLQSEPVKLPLRSEVSKEDSWDLTSLYPTDAAWEADYAELEQTIPKLSAFAGTLGTGIANLRAFLELDVSIDRRLSKLYNYAQRRSDEDTTNGFYQGLSDRISGLWSRAAEAGAFFRSELLSLDDKTLGGYLQAPELADFQFLLQQILRAKPHTLSGPEERLLAMSSEISRAPEEIFSQLNDGDLDFGSIEDDSGRLVEVTHGSYAVFLNNPNRDVRKRFFEKFYAGYDAHKNTFSATLSAAVKRNVFYARARGFSSAREAALFSTEVPVTVYDALLDAVGESLPSLYRYYELRKKLLSLDELRFYDCYVPVIPDMAVHHTYEEGVRVVIESLAPLGGEYTKTLQSGLLGGWVDRYENKGKRSGAYSAGCYDSDPFILLNYKSNELDHVYTLTHEAGHSMHSWYSRRHQSPQYASYKIFVAEVASTFNEVLLTQHLLDNSEDDRMKAFIINRELDMIRGTIFRQTMFADFEHLIHRHAEQQKAMSIDAITELYHSVLTRYFGPDFELDPLLDLECFRIPHFYYNFYVFQYATGLSAGYALANRVLAGDPKAREDYLGFLQAGGSKYPVQILKDAGVDMTEPTPVRAALAHFDSRLTELEELVAKL